MLGANKSGFKGRAILDTVLGEPNNVCAAPNWPTGNGTRWLGEVDPPWATRPQRLDTCRGRKDYVGDWIKGMSRWNAIRWRTRFSSVGRGVLCLWMGLWLVQVPLPVAHEHDGHVGGAAWSPGLWEHLVRFHGRDGDRGRLSWHVHWVVSPDFGANCPDDQSDEPRGEDIIVQGPAVCSASLIMAEPGVGLNDLLDFGLRDTATLRRLAGGKERRQFLDVHSSALPVRALLCVARC
jgi:hypothetical protein